MKLLVGLGNPGENYKGTRHNTGFMVLDRLAEELNIDSWRFDNKFNALIAETFSKGQEKIILAKPQTYMNSSGQAVAKIADYFNITLENIIVIHDDLDLNLGEIKIQESRGSAGHKGVDSIIRHLGTKNFKRIRVGIKPEGAQIKNPESFVIQKFNESEQEVAKETIKKATPLIQQELRIKN